MGPAASGIEPGTDGGIALTRLMVMQGRRASTARRWRCAATHVLIPPQKARRLSLLCRRTVFRPSHASCLSLSNPLEPVAPVQDLPTVVFQLVLPSLCLSSLCSTVLSPQPVIAAPKFVRGALPCWMPAGSSATSESAINALSSRMTPLFYLGSNPRSRFQQAGVSISRSE